ncbi:MAG: transcription-repair coupling factor [Bacilli bacterium]|nr:transcription-repair coupling factor [Bacilli bacterium]
MTPFLHILPSSNEDTLVGLTQELKAIRMIEEFENKSVLFVANSLYEANEFYKTLSQYTEDVLFFPMDDFLTSEALAISPEFKYKRLETLNTLLLNTHKIVVTNLMGYLRFLPQKTMFHEKQIHLKVEEEYPISDLITHLFDLGYTKETLVSKTGEIAPRGFVLDVFPLNEDNPIRISFWGDTIESIKYFDVDSQFTTKEVNELTIYPNTEFITEKEVPFEEKKQKNLYKYTSVTSILSYLETPTVFFNNVYDMAISYTLLKEEMENYSLSNEMPKETKYMHDFSFEIKDKTLFFTDFDNAVSKQATHYKSTLIEPFTGTKEQINIRLNAYLKSKKKIYICVNHRYNAQKIIDELDNNHIIFTSPEEYIPDKINLVVLKMSEGFIYEDYVVITEKEIFNKKDVAALYKTKFKMGSRIRDISKLNVGDYIVHSTYGIGQYAGIKTLVKNGLQKDYLMVNYAGNDKVYIPVEKIDLISKYSSNEGLVPKLNKLGSTDWQKTKLRVQKKIEDIAGELLELYAERENAPGFSFAEDTKEQYEFENEFAYNLTNDQSKACIDIKKDMEKPHPMDRLLCGDVGFGKTEVAFRAMFKAVMSGKQVALLCPTTILSSQHYQNAEERFASFGVNIALLNRFVTGNKLKQTLQRIADGKVDIIIGTHKLLGKDVTFKDLGLLVIDEEQRFGVKHKEKIKQYKNNVDVLTLSATPIPRTLQMSMSGLRSLSLIETPPIDRYPIQTYVLAENNQIMKDAIYKELSRNGQVFLLYNYVDGVEAKAKEINRIVPEARIRCAHGRLSKTELENIMMDFTNHEFDILICTTIIETGIDIPNVNTLIILDADHFGLSQLYQIRGRVGRSNRIAYCYLMYDKRKILSEIATKRLKVIKDFTELGSGFAIAVRDLSIRGAGDILGSEQAGFIDSVGVEMFLSMLDEEIKKLRGVQSTKDEIETDMPLVDVETTIADTYVLEEELKIEIHKKINEIDSKESLENIRIELEDRFGKITEEMKIYMYEEWFEKLAKQLHIDKVRQTKNSIEITIPKNMDVDGQKLFMDLSDIGRMFRFSSKFGSLIVTLDIVHLEKHFIYYLIEFMQILEKSKKED